MPAALAARVAAAVEEVVRKQAEAGIDVVNDGEMSKPSYATYIKDRLDGFGGDGNTFVYQDLVDFPKLAKRVFGDPGRSRRKTPACNARDRRARSRRPRATDVAHLQRGASPRRRAQEAFLTAASPGVVSLFFRNDHYPSDEAYLEAIAEAMRDEYETIADAGLVLQIDCPDLGMGRHIQYADLALAEFRKKAQLHVEALNHATAQHSARPAADAPVLGQLRRTAPLRRAAAPTSSTSSSARGRRRSRSRRRTRGTRTSGSCSRRSSCPTARS